MIYKQVLDETNQHHATRQQLFEDLEDHLGKPVISFFVSFKFPVMMDDQDADILESLLKDMDLSDGLALVINSPGGKGLAAERIIQVCRAYSGTGDYVTLVPNQAKSAATMVCFGASRIYMGPTSELGPIDPQVTHRTPDGIRRFSVYNIINSYEDLFSRATAADGNLEPYLQQLKRYDEKVIRKYRDEFDLSKDIAIKSLGGGMMSGSSDDEIEDDIDIFLTPIETKTHGRPIYRDEATRCGLEVEAVNKASDLWSLMRALYVRTNHFVSRDQQFAKCVETKEHSFYSSSRS